MVVNTAYTATPATMAANIKKISKVSNIKSKTFTGSSFSTTASSLGATKILFAGISSFNCGTSVDYSNWSYSFDGSTTYSTTTASGSLKGSRGGTGSGPKGKLTATWIVFYI